jgi:hypothetical protein
MLLSCSYQGDNCYASNFSSFDHSIYGRCHTIIIDRSYTTLIGSTAGLVLTLNVESSEYIPEIWTQLGFQVNILVMLKLLIYYSGNGSSARVCTISGRFRIRYIARFSDTGCHQAAAIDSITVSVR